MHSKHVYDEPWKLIIIGELYGKHIIFKKN